ncbi:hypothetical protein LU699_13110 [Luteimonas fraxinea]|uniref:Uncharacterized protein n=1 Tax=Luteimonas fraxinea TaxID=2901869 RepID=A0ABS8UGE9_9GAMM|nr:hypothetical protein [Luteimonas fraxinea]MCD9098047.1 hypothetical protein [Luteimonas fraxinea]UHH09228.1 hypothetical protein LU699_13110 [Luteimonas fraxinea]
MLKKFRFSAAALVLAGAAAFVPAAQAAESVEPTEGTQTVVYCDETGYCIIIFIVTLEQCLPGASNVGLRTSSSTPRRI